MFSVRQKRYISDAVQAILKSTGHPELPSGEIQFSLHVDGAEAWSWADIRNNGAVANPGVNPLWSAIRNDEQWQSFMRLLDDLIAEVRAESSAQLLQATQERDEARQELPIILKRALTHEVRVALTNRRFEIEHWTLPWPPSRDYRLAELDDLLAMFNDESWVAALAAEAPAEP